MSTSITKTGPTHKHSSGDWGNSAVSLLLRKHGVWLFWFRRVLHVLVHLVRPPGLFFWPILWSGTWLDSSLLLLLSADLCQVSSFVAVVALSILEAALVSGMNSSTPIATVLTQWLDRWKLCYTVQWLVRVLHVFSTLFHDFCGLSQLKGFLEVMLEFCQKATLHSSVPDAAYQPVPQHIIQCVFKFAVLQETTKFCDELSSWFIFLLGTEWNLKRCTMDDGGGLW